jgi:hypothetical protein
MKYGSLGWRLWNGRRFLEWWVGTFHSVLRCRTMEIQNRCRFPAGFERRCYAVYAHIYFVLDSVRKLSEARSQGRRSDLKLRSGNFSRALCLDLSLSEVSNCFRGEKSRTESRNILLPTVTSVQSVVCSSRQRQVKRQRRAWRKLRQIQIINDNNYNSLR